MILMVLRRRALIYYLFLRMALRPTGSVSESLKNSMAHFFLDKERVTVLFIQIINIIETKKMGKKLFNFSSNFWFYFYYYYFLPVYPSLRST